MTDDAAEAFSSSHDGFLKPRLGGRDSESSDSGRGATLAPLKPSRATGSTLDMSGGEGIHHSPEEQQGHDPSASSSSQLFQSADGHNEQPSNKPLGGSPRGSSVPVHAPLRLPRELVESREDPDTKRTSSLPTRRGPFACLPRFGGGGQQGKKRGEGSRRGRSPKRNVRPLDRKRGGVQMCDFPGWFNSQTVPERPRGSREIRAASSLTEVRERDADARSDSCSSGVRGDSEGGSGTVSEDNAEGEEHEREGGNNREEVSFEEQCRQDAIQCVQNIGRTVLAKLAPSKHRRASNEIAQKHALAVAPLPQNSGNSASDTDFRKRFEYASRRRSEVRKYFPDEASADAELALRRASLRPQGSQAGALNIRYPRGSGTQTSLDPSASALGGRRRDTGIGTGVFDFVPSAEGSGGMPLGSPRSSASDTEGLHARNGALRAQGGRGGRENRIQVRGSEENFSVGVRDRIAQFEQQPSTRLGRGPSGWVAPPLPIYGTAARAVEGGEHESGRSPALRLAPMPPSAGVPTPSPQSSSFVSAQEEAEAEEDTRPADKGEEEVREQAPPPSLSAASVSAQGQVSPSKKKSSERGGGKKERRNEKKESHPSENDGTERGSEISSRRRAGSGAPSRPSLRGNTLKALDTSGGRKESRKGSAAGMLVQEGGGEEGGVVGSSRARGQSGRVAAPPRDPVLFSRSFTSIANSRISGSYSGSESSLGNRSGDGRGSRLQREGRRSSALSAGNSGGVSPSRSTHSRQKHAKRKGSTSMKDKKSAAANEEREEKKKVETTPLNELPVSASESEKPPLPSQQQHEEQPPPVSTKGREEKGGLSGPSSSSVSTLNVSQKRALFEERGRDEGARGRTAEGTATQDPKEPVSSSSSGIPQRTLASPPSASVSPDAEVQREEEAGSRADPADCANTEPKKDNQEDGGWKSGGETDTDAEGDDGPPSLRPGILRSAGGQGRSRVAEWLQRNPTAAAAAPQTSAASAGAGERDREGALQEGASSSPLSLQRNASRSVKELRESFERSESTVKDTSKSPVTPSEAGPSSSSSSSSSVSGPTRSIPDAEQTSAQADGAPEEMGEGKGSGTRGVERRLSVNDLKKKFEANQQNPNGPPRSPSRLQERRSSSSPPGPAKVTPDAELKSSAGDGGAEGRKGGKESTDTLSAEAETKREEAKGGEAPSVGRKLSVNDLKKQFEGIQQNTPSASASSQGQQGGAMRRVSALRNQFKSSPGSADSPSRATRGANLNRQSFEGFPFHSTQGSANMERSVSAMDVRAPTSHTSSPQRRSASLSPPLRQMTSSGDLEADLEQFALQGLSPARVRRSIPNGEMPPAEVGTGPREQEARGQRGEGKDTETQRGKRPSSPSASRAPSSLAASPSGQMAPPPPPPPLSPHSSSVNSPSKASNSPPPRSPLNKAGTVAKLTKFFEETNAVRTQPRPTRSSSVPVNPLLSDGGRGGQSPSSRVSTQRDRRSASVSPVRAHERDDDGTVSPTVRGSKRSAEDASDAASNAPSPFRQGVEAASSSSAQPPSASSPSPNLRSQGQRGRASLQASPSDDNPPVSSPNHPGTLSPNRFPPPFRVADSSQSPKREGSRVALLARQIEERLNRSTANDSRGASPASRQIRSASVPAPSSPSRQNRGVPSPPNTEGGNAESLPAEETDLPAPPQQNPAPLRDATDSSESDVSTPSDEVVEDAAGSEGSAVSEREDAAGEGQAVPSPQRPVRDSNAAEDSAGSCQEADTLPSPLSQNGEEGSQEAGLFRQLFASFGGARGRSGFGGLGRSTSEGVEGEEREGGRERGRGSQGRSASAPNFRDLFSFTSFRRAEREELDGNESEGSLESCDDAEETALSLGEFESRRQREEETDQRKKEAEKGDSSSSESQAEEEEGEGRGELEESSEEEESEITPSQTVPLNRLCPPQKNEEDGGASLDEGSQKKASSSSCSSEEEAESVSEVRIEPEGGRELVNENEQNDSVSSSSPSSEEDEQRGQKSEEQERCLSGVSLRDADRVSGQNENSSKQASESFSAPQPRADGDLGSSASLDESLKASEAEEEEESSRFSSSSVTDREEVGRGEVEEMEEEREAGNEGDDQQERKLSEHPIAEEQSPHQRRILEEGVSQSEGEEGGDASKQQTEEEEDEEEQTPTPKAIPFSLHTPPPLSPPAGDSAPPAAPSSFVSPPRASGDRRDGTPEETGDNRSPSVSPLRGPLPSFPAPPSASPEAASSSNLHEGRAVEVDGKNEGVVEGEGQETSPLSPAAPSMGSVGGIRDRVRRLLLSPFQRGRGVNRTASVNGDGGVSESGKEGGRQARSESPSLFRAPLRFFSPSRRVPEPQREEEEGAEHEGFSESYNDGEERAMSLQEFELQQQQQEGENEGEEQTLEENNEEEGQSEEENHEQNEEGLPRGAPILATASGGERRENEPRGSIGEEEGDENGSEEEGMEGEREKEEVQSESQVAEDSLRRDQGSCLSEEEEEGGEIDDEEEEEEEDGISNEGNQRRVNDEEKQCSRDSEETPQIPFSSIHTPPPLSPPPAGDSAPPAAPSSIVSPPRASGDRRDGSPEETGDNRSPSISPLRGPSPSFAAPFVSPERRPSRLQEEAEAGAVDGEAMDASPLSPVAPSPDSVGGIRERVQRLFASPFRGRGVSKTSSAVHDGGVEDSATRGGRQRSASPSVFRFFFPSRQQAPQRAETNQDEQPEQKSSLDGREEEKTLNARPPADENEEERGTGENSEEQKEKSGGTEREADEESLERSHNGLSGGEEGESLVEEENKEGQSESEQMSERNEMAEECRGVDGTEENSEVSETEGRGQAPPFSLHTPPPLSPPAGDSAPPAAPSSIVSPPRASGDRRYGSPEETGDNRSPSVSPLRGPSASFPAPAPPVSPEAASPSHLHEEGGAVEVDGENEGVVEGEGQETSPPSPAAPSTGSVGGIRERVQRLLLSPFLRGRGVNRAASVNGDGGVSESGREGGRQARSESPSLFRAIRFFSPSRRVPEQTQREAEREEKEEEAEHEGFSESYNDGEERALSLQEFELQQQQGESEEESGGEAEADIRPIEGGQDRATDQEESEQEEDEGGNEEAQQRGIPLAVNNPQEEEEDMWGADDERESEEEGEEIVQETVLDIVSDGSADSAEMEEEGEEGEGEEDEWEDTEEEEEEVGEEKEEEGNTESQVLFRSRTQLPQMREGVGVVRTSARHAAVSPPGSCSHLSSPSPNPVSMVQIAEEPSVTEGEGDVSGEEDKGEGRLENPRSEGGGESPIQSGGVSPGGDSGSRGILSGVARFFSKWHSPAARLLSRNPSEAPDADETPASCMGGRDGSQNSPPQRQQAGRSLSPPRLFSAPSRAATGTENPIPSAEPSAEQPLQATVQEEEGESLRLRPSGPPLQRAAAGGGGDGEGDGSDASSDSDSDSSFHDVGEGVDNRGGVSAPSSPRPGEDNVHGEMGGVVRGDVRQPSLPVHREAERDGGVEGEERQEDETEEAEGQFQLPAFLQRSGHSDEEEEENEDIPSQSGASSISPPPRSPSLRSGHPVGQQNSSFQHSSPSAQMDADTPGGGWHPLSGTPFGALRAQANPASAFPLPNNADRRGGNAVEGSDGGSSRVSRGSRADSRSQFGRFFLNLCEGSPAREQSEMSRQSGQPLQNAVGTLFGHGGVGVPPGESERSYLGLSRSSVGNPLLRTQQSLRQALGVGASPDARLLNTSGLSGLPQTRVPPRSLSLLQSRQNRSAGDGGEEMKGPERRVEGGFVRGGHSVGRLGSFPQESGAREGRERKGGDVQEREGDGRTGAGPVPPGPKYRDAASQTISMRVPPSLSPFPQNRKPEEPPHNLPVFLTRSRSAEVLLFPADEAEERRKRRMTRQKRKDAQKQKTSQRVRSADPPVRNAISTGPARRTAVPPARESRFVIGEVRPRPIDSRAPANIHRPAPPPSHPSVTSSQIPSASPNPQLPQRRMPPPSVDPSALQQVAASMEAIRTPPRATAGELGGRQGRRGSGNRRESGGSISGPNGELLSLQGRPREGRGIRAGSEVSWEDPEMDLDPSISHVYPKDDVTLPHVNRSGFNGRGRSWTPDEARLAYMRRRSRDVSSGVAAVCAELPEILPLPTVSGPVPQSSTNKLREFESVLEKVGGPTVREGRTKRVLEVVKETEQLQESMREVMISTSSLLCNAQVAGAAADAGG
uniref:Uncharacterized protein n=1 Tax=Chromera velia CCMP2878 TaxID=1169474 RepID=A0A0G4HM15_9ALVE|eukprot:Cvel_7426.t1-p1 / transcript=Cvel_7426.t1 / gene=Cvel_7426 / organism=Chromera_velia_CCMP2878 / gene_product=hypothetical protein / transcript_product=hypothetical protein / location=Cvel_scaffold388:28353-42704(-) / protein_length=4171 / sequence_SO=supercontig / SO=protein_coding / is_pseudo=false